MQNADIIIAILIVAVLFSVIAVNLEKLGMRKNETPYHVTGYQFPRLRRPGGNKHRNSANKTIQNQRWHYE